MEEERKIAGVKERNGRRKKDSWSEIKKGGRKKDSWNEIKEGKKKER
jgi:hypothetical protein